MNVCQELFQYAGEVLEVQLGLVQLKFLITESHRHLTLVLKQ